MYHYIVIIIINKVKFSLDFCNLNLKIYNSYTKLKIFVVNYRFFF